MAVASVELAEDRAPNAYQSPSACRRRIDVQSADAGRPGQSATARASSSVVSGAALFAAGAVDELGAVDPHLPARAGPFELRRAEAARCRLERDLVVAACAPGRRPARRRGAALRRWSRIPAAAAGGASAVLGVGVVEAAARVPLRALVAVRGDAAGVLEHPRQVQQVPRHERGVAVGEVVLGPARARRRGSSGPGPPRRSSRRRPAAGSCSRGAGASRGCSSRSA